MDNKVPQKLSGPKLLIYILGNIVKDVCNCNLVRQRLIDRQDDYPFVTFNLITLNEELSSEWLGDERQYYVDMQIDIHDSDYLNGMDLVNKLYSALRKDKYRMCFSQANMVPTHIYDVTDRTTSPDVNYDYCFGFDCRFLINGNAEYELNSLRFDFEETEITSITAKNQVQKDTNINVNKNMEERQW